MSSEIDDANAAMTTLAVAIGVVANSLRAGVIEPAAVEGLTTQMKAQVDAINEAVAFAKTARGEA